MIVKQRWLAFSIMALACLGVLWLDLFLLPGDSRVDLPYAPLSFTFLALFFLVLGGAWLYCTWRQLIWVAVGLSLLMFIGPVVLALQAVDVTDVIIGRRVWTLLLIWILVVVVINRKRRAELLQAAKTDLEQQVEARTRELGQALEAGRQSQKRLHSLMQVAFDGMVVTENGVIVEVDAASAARLGYLPEEIVGRSTLDLVVPAFHSRAHGTLAMAQTRTPVEMALQHRDGSTVYVEYVATDVDDGDRKLRVIGLRDIETRLELEREIVVISEQERTRIGYDLHDDVGQVLVSAKWAAQRLVDRIPESDIQLSQDSRRVLELVEQAISETQRASSRLAPQVLSTTEIYPALRMLSANVNRHPGLHCTLECSKHEGISAGEATIHLYRIAEESITNALKHSQAQNIELRFGRRGDSYVLEVLDDGIGIPEASERKDGVGVRSIHYRARLIQGTVDIGPRSEGGTRVACSFPA